MPRSLSLAEARRLAIGAQGFGPRPAKPTIAHLRKLASRIHAFQIDSVNVLVRAHYVPAFARLGPYPMEALDTLAYRQRELFEYWGHAACLMPTRLFPLLRFRMHSEDAHAYMASERGAYVKEVYAEVAERGPLAAGELSNPGKRSGNWWGWGSGKSALEYLYDNGVLAIAGRRGFERLYDVVERVIPPAALELSVPREEAMKQLLVLAAQAYGVGTAVDLAGYFKLDRSTDRHAGIPGWDRESQPSLSRTPPVVRQLLAELVEEGRLLRASVEGWTEPTFVHPDARIPREVDARALVTPFDSLVWERSRIKRLFGMHYAIELYTPAPKRTYGYYVCPFLLGDTLVARCDLKADRARKTLLVHSAHLEAGQSPEAVVEPLLAELLDMQVWLGLERMEIGGVGDLGPALRDQALASRSSSTGQGA
jgi:uncharacterized protein YcaQ